MNTLNPNFAARLAASSPATPAHSASSAAADSSGAPSSGTSFSAHLRKQNAQASASPEPASHDKPAVSEPGTRRVRKVAEGTKPAADGNSLPLPGVLPPVMPPAPVVAGAGGPGVVTDDQTQQGTAGSAAALGSLSVSAPVTAASVVTTAAAMLDTTGADPADSSASAPDAAGDGAAVGSAAIAAGTKALASAAHLKAAASASPASVPVTAVAKVLVSAAQLNQLAEASAVTARADAAVAAAAPSTGDATAAAATTVAATAGSLFRDVSITTERSGGVVTRAGLSRAAAADTAAPVTLAAAPTAAPRIAPDTTAAIALSEAIAAAQARTGSGGDARLSKQEDLPAADAAAPATAVPLVPLLDPTGGNTAPAAAATIPSAPAVHVPVGSPDWGRQVGESVTWAANQKLTHATISLNPDHLGPLEIRLSLVGGEASVAFATHSHATAAALQASSGQLRDMLSQAGFTQVNVDVSQQSGKQQSFAGSAYKESGASPGNAAPVAEPISSPLRAVSRSQFDAYA